MNEPTMANDGRVGFYTVLSGTGVNGDNDTAMFAGMPGDMHLLVRENDLAPGAGGARFAGFDFTHLNGSGEGVFWSILRGDAVDATNDHAVYGVDHLGELHLLGREGDAFTLAPGDVRIIEDIDYTREYVNHSGGDGFPRSINDDGQVALRIGFTDGSVGLFIASIPVPEPASLSACGVGAAAMWYARRRRPR
jgi:hypothetical protein